MSKIEKKIQSKCTLSLATTWPVPWNTTLAPGYMPGRSAQPSQFCIPKEFFSSNTRSQPTMSWAFWKPLFLFPLPWEVSCDCLLYCWPLHSVRCFSRMCSFPLCDLNEEFAKSICCCFSGFLSFLANEQLYGKKIKTVKLRRGLLSLIQFFISLWCLNFILLCIYWLLN